MAKEQQPDLEAALGEGEDEFEKEHMPGFPRIVPRLKRAPSMRSHLSNHSLRPGHLIKRFTAQSRRGTGAPPTQAAEIPREFITFLSEGQTQPHSPAFIAACQWFARFIDIKYAACWSTLILPNVAFPTGENEESERPTPTPAGRLPSIPETAISLVPSVAPSPEESAAVDHVLSLLARALEKLNHFALVDIENDLVNDLLLKDDAENERAALHKLVFTFAGWLSMLYEPDLHSNLDGFHINEPSAITTSGERIFTKSRTVNKIVQSLDQSDHPLHQLLSRFGKLIPEPQLRRPGDVAPPSDWIIAPYICYQTLRKVCRIEIEWVDTLGMHLEFDSSGKKLKVFRFPSFCRLMYRQGRKGPLSQLFDDNARDLRGEYTPGSASANDYFREMLLTYRLIFSQDTASHRLFEHETTTQSHQADLHPRARAKWNRSASFSGLKGKLKPKANSNILQLRDADPLLAILCSNPPSDPRITALFDELSEPSSPEAYYMPHTFPFFAKKILILQAYVKEQNPHDWNTLWHDHRNKSNWWQFWAVLFIGGGTLILGALGVVLQLWQCVLSLEQLKQGVAGVATPSATRMMIRDGFVPPAPDMVVAGAGVEVREMTERLFGVAFFLLIVVIVMRGDLILRVLARISGIRFRNRRRYGWKKNMA